MKKLLLVFGLALTLTIVTTNLGYSQFKNIESNPHNKGNIVNQDKGNNGSFFNNWDMQMSHSYSMTFSTFGGETQNINMYTNSMDFYFSDKLTGDLDISFMHSPFGSNLMQPDQGSAFNGKVFINNAQINYQLGKNAQISVQFSQNPYGYGYPYGMRGGPGSINNVFIN